MSAALDLDSLTESWHLALRAERKSANTIRAYLASIDAFRRWCAAEGVTAKLDRPTVAAFVSSLLDAGQEPTTARNRQLGLRRFTAWLADEGEIDSDPLAGMKPPKLDAKVIQPLTDAQIKALLKACQGNDFIDRRDEALVRLMLESGLRAGEVIIMHSDDIDLIEGVAVVRRGKGGKGRVVPFGPQTARALDRYRRRRAQHALADRPQFWLGSRNRTLAYDGLRIALGRRAEAAGIKGFHPHLLRHTAAHRWLAAGGSEQGLMTVAGWTRPDMVQRYTRARASERAAAEARALNLGDI